MSLQWPLPEVVGAWLCLEMLAFLIRYYFLLIYDLLVYSNFCCFFFFYTAICYVFWKLFLGFLSCMERSFKVVELDFLYPSEGIHRRWESGYRITCMAATADQAAFILSIPKRKLMDETQETLRTSAFPSTHVKVGTHLRNEIYPTLRCISCCIYLCTF